MSFNESKSQVGQAGGATSDKLATRKQCDIAGVDAWFVQASGPHFHVVPVGLPCDQRLQQFKMDDLVAVTPGTLDVFSAGTAAQDHVTN